MSWVMTGIAAAGLAMQIGSQFTKDEGTKRGLSLGGSALTLGGGFGAGGGFGGGFGSGAGAGASGTLDGIVSSGGIGGSMFGAPQQAFESANSGGIFSNPMMRQVGPDLFTGSLKSMLGGGQEQSPVLPPPPQLPNIPMGGGAIGSMQQAPMIVGTKPIGQPQEMDLEKLMLLRRMGLIG